MAFIAPPRPPTAIPLSIALPHKPSAALSCTLVPATAPTHNTTLVIFLNGLGLPQAAWWPTITRLGAQTSHPPLLTYDRYGQGMTTDKDPQDSDDNPNPLGQRHDLVSVVHDLHALVSAVASHASFPPLCPDAPLKLVFVANSVGCPIARHYAATYPGTVAALLLLDSYMTDTDFISLYPDPDAPGFDEGLLPAGITAADLRIARTEMGRLFHPRVLNAEGFWRGNMSAILPRADLPRLLAHGPGGPGPYVTVVGHDWETFAEDGLRTLGIAKAVTMEYTNPSWGSYNEGLLKVTDQARAKGMIADGAGHFVQKDRPDVVAVELDRLLKLVQEAS
ncbi:hypothetical protein DRE_07757 [Drechslerella stenobrocha 248]|uniref:AB hydrolase-1 domain-containing protein n=1 Tax=Drechslerella stenobrocha 248 TaxID=1043628 RepID=W7HWG7_9PEZI|nr:hypothetical protein DRE_07757 [Drechslerella stenobrocha 248]